MTKENKKPWENYTPPGGQIHIEGTDDLPLDTNRLVDVVPKMPKNVPPEAERLFVVEPVEQPATPTSTRQPKKPHRARYSDTTDYSVRQLKPDEEKPLGNPDQDIDDIFGAEQARRII